MPRRITDDKAAFVGGLCADISANGEHDQPPHDDEGGYRPGDYFQFFFRRVVAYFSAPELAP
jgi:hypothetical protein